MFNAAIKIAYATATITLSMAIASCGSSDKHQQALAMYNQADSAFQCKDYVLARNLLDTLTSRYASETEIQRQVMHLRPMVIEQSTIREMESCDSTTAALEAQKAALTDKFSFINNPELVEGYFVSKKVPGNLFASGGLEARITPSGEYYMISSVAGRNIKHTHVAVSSGSESVSSAVVNYDGNRNYSSSGTEMITYTAQECDTIGKFVLDHKQASVTVTFQGSGSYKTILTQNQKEAIAETYEMALVMRELGESKRRREFLDRQLALARDQIARTTQDSKRE